MAHHQNEESLSIRQIGRPKSGKSVHKPLAVRAVGEWLHNVTGTSAEVVEGKREQAIAELKTDTESEAPIGLLLEVSH
jgi:hypothetical protein